MRMTSWASAIPESESWTATTPATNAIRRRTEVAIGFPSKDRGNVFGKPKAGSRRESIERFSAGGHEHEVDPMLQAERAECLHLALGRKQRLPSDADAAGAPSELRAGRQCREKVLERFDRPEPAVPDDEEKLRVGRLENRNELELVGGRRFLRPRPGRVQDSQGRDE